jgi:ADP-ribose pyrophosphatase YjhB (NUDIX family)/uncharacterized protein (UPF0303 family)
MSERHRLSSRVLLFDRDGRILMFLTTGDNGEARWLTPGGGVDEGEGHEDGAYRELFEETGLTDVPLGEAFASYDFDATYGALDHDTGHAEYYTATVDPFEPSNEHWTESEKIDVLAHRWWSIEELESTTEPFEPPHLIDLIRTARGSTQGASSMSDDVPHFTVEELESVEPARLSSFSNADAVTLGILATNVIIERGRNLAVDVRLGDDLVYRAKLGTTGQGNDEWLFGKAATTRAFREPSLLVRRRTEDGAELEISDDLKVYGGSIPIFVGDDLVATITMSGEPDHIDHATCAEAVERYLASLASAASATAE